ncbi:MAG: diguanylate cyclase [Chloroflexia bacterium]|nr:diguanylate cyclase [Chloroflexia bacterium]
MTSKARPYIIAGVIGWLVLISLSAAWNIVQVRQKQHDIYLQNGRVIFDLIVTTRAWNSQHGGVYMPVSDRVEPNPYLEVPHRDLTTTNGQVLTLINPAYMTRLIAELANQQDHINLHITSLNPIRSANAPEDWEAEALRIFEERVKTEYTGYAQDGDTIFFQYMAPLITQQSCLQCHEKQGYKLGDIRGGISVSFPVQFTIPWALVFSHLFFGVVGSSLILVFGAKLGNTIKVLEDLSDLDGLTRIHNRRYFDEQVKREYLHSKRNKVHLSIAICDIDNFKAYNDTYGHPAGDECLKQVAQVLKQVLKRPGDLLARYGGEEFGILLPYTGVEGALELGALLCANVEALRIPHKASEASAYVTISIGIATYTGDEKSLANVIKLADLALYKAKAGGKNHVEHMLVTRTVAHGN